jgi:5,10-methylenetetrahydromethanopterin reductase
VAATVHEESNGRFVLGIGRGDTALFHLGRKPMPTAEFFRRVTALQSYLRKDTVDCDGYPSKLRWLDRARQSKVPLDIASSGPKVIAFAAEAAERMTLAVGADATRIKWAIDLAHESGTPSIGAYVTVGCHPDPAVARELVRGSVAAFAHFSAMPGSTGAGLDDHDRAVVAEVGRQYDSNLHLVNAAPHAASLEADFVDRFAIVGPPDVCIARLLELRSLGVERFVITGPSFGAARDDARLADQLVRDEVLPALRAAG